MKQLLLFIGLACVLAFAGCSKSETPETPNYTEPYIGIWEKTAFQSTNGVFIDQRDLTSIRFNNDGTFYLLYINYGYDNQHWNGTYKMTSESSMELSITGITRKATIEFYDMERNVATLRFKSLDISVSQYLNNGVYKFEKL